MFEPCPQYFFLETKNFGPRWKGTITASKLAALLHVDDFSTARQAAERMFGNAPSPLSKSFQQEALKHGNNMEPVAKQRLRELRIKEFERYSFRDPREDGNISYTAVYRKIEDNFHFCFSATPDMMLTYPWLIGKEKKPTGKQFFPVEIKCPYYAYINGLGREGIRFKHSHWVQLMVQCIVTASDIGYLAIYIPGVGEQEKLVIWRVNATEESKNFILGKIYEIYMKSLQVKDGDFKIFRAKNGEKKQSYTKIDELMKKTTKIIFEM